LETVSLIRTLHTYIARELARTTLLALVAFTLVMTVCRTWRLCPEGRSMKESGPT